MFEAGFFGTIEDLYLGAKGGLESRGRSIEEKVMYNNKAKVESEKLDQKYEEKFNTKYTKAEVEAAEDVTKNCIRVFKKKGYEMYDLMSKILIGGEESMFVLEGSAAIKILSQQDGVQKYADLFKEGYGVPEISIDKVMEILKQNRWLYNTVICGTQVSQSTNKGGSIKEIQNMRHLLDIMERNIEGRLTTQDKADLQNKAQEWKCDIEKLIHMLAEIKN